MQLQYILDSLKGSNISERQVSIKWWKVGRWSRGFRLRDEAHHRVVSLADLATEKQDLLVVLCRGAVYEVIRVQIAVVYPLNVPWTCQNSVLPGFERSWCSSCVVSCIVNLSTFLHVYIWKVRWGNLDPPLSKETYMIKNGKIRETKINSSGHEKFLNWDAVHLHRTKAIVYSSILYKNRQFTGPKEQKSSLFFCN